TVQDSFIVQYPEPRPNNSPKWFFVPHLTSKQSESFDTAIGQYLIENGLVEPELTDKEYQVQLALGSIDCRVYKVVPSVAMNKI
ncbi:MAG: hypothetical protein U9R15_16205, partial [Chloroflexota bacterium]|nr:hypothetical protein [Chloroflexota bacterium]